MEGTILPGIIGILIIILAILAILMPLFVFQIRDHTKSINKKLSTLIDILQNKNPPVSETTPDPTPSPLPATRYEKVGFIIGRSFDLIIIGLIAILFGAWITYLVLKYLGYLRV